MDICDLMIYEEGMTCLYDDKNELNGNREQCMG